MLEIQIQKEERKYIEKIFNLKEWQENMLHKSGLPNWICKCFILKPDLDIDA